MEETERKTRKKPGKQPGFNKKISFESSFQTKVYRMLVLKLLIPYTSVFLRFFFSNINHKVYSNLVSGK